MPAPPPIAFVTPQGAVELNWSIFEGRWYVAVGVQENIGSDIQLIFNNRRCSDDVISGLKLNNVSYLKTICNESQRPQLLFDVINTTSPSSISGEDWLMEIAPK